MECDSGAELSRCVDVLVQVMLLITVAILLALRCKCDGSIRKTQGATSLRAIAQVLNDRGIPTPRGGTWAPMQVKNILDRASG
jgi:hypothetical protein